MKIFLLPLLLLFMIVSCSSSSRTNEENWKRSYDLKEINLNRKLSFGKGTTMFYIPSGKAVKYSYRGSQYDGYVPYMVSLHDLNLEGYSLDVEFIAGDNFYDVVIPLKQISSSEFVTQVLRENRSILPRKPNGGLGQSYFRIAAWSKEDAQGIIKTLTELRK